MQQNLFTDAEMSLFRVAAPTAKRGRGPTPGTTSAYGSDNKSRRKCIYSVNQNTVGGLLNREYRMPLFDAVGERGTMIVDIGANASTRIGHGFAIISFKKADGNWNTVVVDATTLRNLAQMFNAVANSARAKWRK